MVKFRTATLLLTVPLFLAACNKPAAPAAEATENTMASEEMNATASDGMNAATTASAGNSADAMAAGSATKGVPEVSSSGGTIVPSNSSIPAEK